MPFFVIFILLLGPVITAGGVASGHVHWSLHSGKTQVLVVMFVPAMFFYFQAVKLFWRLLADIQAGTIEQVYLSPLPSWLTAAAGRLAAALIETLFVAGVTLGVVAALAPLHYAWQASALLPFALLVVTGFGYLLIIGGVTLAPAAPARPRRTPTARRRRVHAR